MQSTTQPSSSTASPFSIESTKYRELVKQVRQLRYLSTGDRAKALEIRHAQLAVIRNNMGDLPRTTEQLLALVVHRAIGQHEDSYDEMTGRCTKSTNKCFENACIHYGISPKLAQILDLANHWTNDLQDWADDTLAEIK